MSGPAIYPWCLRRTAGDHAAARVLGDSIVAYLGAVPDDDLWAQLRTRFGTQRALARRVGVTDSAVSLWFSGHSIPFRWWDRVIAAAAALDPPLTLTRSHFVTAHRKRSGEVS